MLSDTLDALLDAYLYKMSMNRICLNMEDELVEADMPDEIFSSVESINTFVAVIKKSSTELKSSLINLQLAGVINSPTYKQAKRIVDDLYELSDKIDDAQWDTHLLRK